MGSEVSRGRRAVFWGGLLLVAVGLALIAYVAWQFWGTNWQSNKRHDQGIHDIQKGWSDGQGSVRTEWGRASAIIEIPRFGEDYRVPVLDGISDEALAAGYGHFDETARPGEVGNYALAGHRVTHGEPLRDMPELRPGDEIRVLTRQATYVYELTTGGDDLTVPFTAGWVLDPLPKNPNGTVQPDQQKKQKLITLTTCSELFHTDDRLIAFGQLVKKEPAPA